MENIELKYIMVYLNLEQSGLTIVCISLSTDPFAPFVLCHVFLVLVLPDILECLVQPPLFVHTGTYFTFHVSFNITLDCRSPSISPSTFQESRSTANFVTVCAPVQLLAGGSIVNSFGKNSVQEASKYT